MYQCYIRLNYLKSTPIIRNLKKTRMTYIVKYTMARYLSFLTIYVYAICEKF